MYLLNKSLRSYFYVLYLVHGNILATVHQKASGNYVIEIKIRLSDKRSVVGKMSGVSALSLIVKAKRESERENKIEKITKEKTYI